MEAEKAHNLLSAGWSPREAGGVIQSKSKGLSTREADDIDSSPGPEAWEAWPMMAAEDGGPQSAVRQGTKGESHPPLRLSVQALRGLDGAHIC